MWFQWRVPTLSPSPLPVPDPDTFYLPGSCLLGALQGAALDPGGKSDSQQIQLQSISICKDRPGASTGCMVPTVGRTRNPRRAAATAADLGPAQPNSSQRPSTVSLGPWVLPVPGWPGAVPSNTERRHPWAHWVLRISLHYRTLGPPSIRAPPWVPSHLRPPAAPFLLSVSPNATWESRTGWSSVKKYVDKIGANKVLEDISDPAWW